MGESSRNVSQASLTEARNKLAAQIGKTVHEPAQVHRKPMGPHSPLKQLDIPLEVLPPRSKSHPVTPSPLVFNPETPGQTLHGVGGRAYPTSFHGTETGLDDIERAGADLRPAGTPQTNLDLPVPVSAEHVPEGKSWMPNLPFAPGKVAGITALGGLVFGPAIYGTQKAIRDNLPHHPNTNGTTTSTSLPTATGAAANVRFAELPTQTPAWAHPTPPASALPSSITIPGEKPQTIALPSQRPSATSVPGGFLGDLSPSSIVPPRPLESDPGIA